MELTPIEKMIAMDTFIEILLFCTENSKANSCSELHMA